jgi:formylmethanofuran dehydrogenase subunit B
MTTTAKHPATAHPTPLPQRSPSNGSFHNVACPFCGIHCDDLDVTNSAGKLKLTNTTCPKAVAGFERTLPEASPQIAGRDVTLAEAITAAASLIAKSKLPLFGGLATDVEGARATMALADRAGGVVDHVLSDAQFRNFRVLQSTGWVMSTLTEVRNRADLIIIAGTDIQEMHPRFYERVVCNAESMFDDPPLKRTVVVIGNGLDTSAIKGPRVDKLIKLDCPLDQVGDVIAALRARLKGVPLTAPSFAGVPISAIDDLADRCHKTAYGVVVWAPPSFDFPNADLTVQLICDMVRELNVKQRFAGLTLGANEGAASAASVSSWQSGYPLRVCFASGKPEHDATRYALNRMLASNEGDLLVWTASFTPGIAVPKTSLPTIVLGTPGLEMAQAPAVFIPVGTPGLDHAGRVVRCDSVVSLPLRNLGRSALPSAASVLEAIEAALHS